MAIYRTIHTGLYSNKAAEIIKSALMSIGNNEYRKNSFPCRTTAEFAKVDFTPEGEIVVTFDNREISSCRLVSYVRCNNDIIARKWLAWQIKDVIKNVNGLNWKRNSEVQCLSKHTDVDITVKEAYCVYDMLMSRQKINKRYDAKMLEDLHGVENDPFKTQMETIRREKINEVKAEYTKLIDDVKIDRYGSKIFNEYDAEVSLIRAKYENMSKQKINELTDEMKNKIKEINEQFLIMNAE